MVLVLVAVMYRVDLLFKIDYLRNGSIIAFCFQEGISIIENATWAPGISKSIKDQISQMKNMKILEETLSIKSSIKYEQEEKLNKIAEDIATDLK